MTPVKVAHASFSGNQSVKKHLDVAYGNIMIVNDGAADIIFSIGTRFFTFFADFPLRPGEVFDEDMPVFDTLTITSDGQPFRVLLRRTGHEGIWDARYLYQ